MGIPGYIRRNLKAIGLGHLLEDERFEKVPAVSRQNRELLRREILKKQVEKTADEWMEIYPSESEMSAWHSGPVDTIFARDIETLGNFTCAAGSLSPRRSIGRAAKPQLSVSHESPHMTCIASRAPGLRGSSIR